ncbi:MAG: efflux RND transporter periplasmic adaptor subunit [Gammaproteobacteria bacterium]|nr:efflux RND transporter periplasmic adaptor subunit [Gammaproteobacteria bacterium]
MILPPTLTPRHFLLLLALGAALISLVIISRPQKVAPLRPPIIPAVVVVEVRQGEVRPTLQLHGRLQPRRSATLAAEVAGRLVARQAEPGQRVVAGTLLLQQEEGDYRDALTRAEAQLEQEREAVARDRRLLALARQGRELQAQELARQERLGSESLSSVSRRDEVARQLLQLQAEEARLDYAVATAPSRLALRAAEQESARRNLARCRIVAPFEGTVNAVLVEEGDRLAPNQPLLSLIDLEEMDFYAELPGDVQSDLTLGQELAVEIDGVARMGELVSLQREPERTTHTLALRVRLAGEGLSPAALATTVVPLRPLADVLLVPVAALLREDGKAYLFVEQGGRLARREVQTGGRDGDAVIVGAGVAAGERVVARDVAALSEGQQVRVVSE